MISFDSSSLFICSLTFTMCNHISKVAFRVEVIRWSILQWVETMKSMHCTVGWNCMKSTHCTVGWNSMKSKHCTVGWNSMKLVHLYHRQKTLSYEWPSDWVSGASKWTSVCWVREAELSGEEQANECALGANKPLCSPHSWINSSNHQLIGLLVGR